MAWYNSSWLYRQKITVDASQVDEVFSLLPIYTSKLNMHYFDHAKAGAADVRITRADGTTEVARYAVAHDATARTGCIIANVLADVSISTNTDYYVYYGNSAASDYATTDTYGRDATFGDYEGAYMPGMTTADLTGGGRTLTAVNGPGTAASGYEGITAATYNGTSSYHKYWGTQGVTAWPLTFEVLGYSESNTTRQFVMAYGSSANNDNVVGLSLDGTQISPVADVGEVVMKGNGGVSSTAFTSASYTVNTWCYLAGTRSGTSGGTGTTTAYINGGNSNSNSTTINALSANQLAFGALWRTTLLTTNASRVAVGLVSNTARSADYVSTMQNAWSSSTFWMAGAIETENGGMTGWRLFQTAATTTASGSHQDWSNPSNALTVNADAATAVLDDATWLLSETLKLTNPDYGITIPSGESTYECQFRVRRTGQTSSAKEIRDYNIQFIDNTGTLVGTNLADTGTVWPASATNADYSVAGVSLTDTKFDADTGIAIQADGTNTNGATTASVITGWINVIWESSGSTTGGDGALTLPAPLEISGAGSVPVVGTGALSLPALTLSGTGSVLVAGSGNLDLPGIEIIGSGGSSVITGSGNLNLPVIDLAGAGSVVIFGSGNIDIPVIEIDGGETPTTTGWFLFQNATAGSASLPTVVGWTSPSNALDADSDVASATLGASYAQANSSELVVRNPLGVSIPEGSIITSIEYRIIRALDTSVGASVVDYSVRPVKGGVAAGDDIKNLDDWTLAYEDVTYGPSLMGLVWGANDFGSDFGLSITVELTNVSFLFPVSAYIKTVYGKINYTSSDAITGTGALELPSITLDTPPNPTGGTATLELPLFTMKGHSYNALCSCCEGYTMRTLIELRRMLVQQSGHAELVADYENEDWADNGADHFIQAGQRFCDDQFQYHKSEAWFYAKVSTGESLVTFTNARIIKQVWLNYTGGNRVLLERLTLDKMREEYTEPLLSSEMQGTPAYWVPAVLGLAPQQYTDTALTFDAEGITDYDLIMFGNHYPYKGIYIMPPADGDYTVEIKAEWYSHEMCEDSDVSFWSQYPELLLMAARRQMEIDLHRNSTGAQDFEAPLMRSLMKLSHNLVAEEWSGPTKVRGEC